MAVKGLDTFIQYLSGHHGAFVLIGGAACDIWFADQNLLFRATKDLDVVLILDKVDASFVSSFWTMIRDGQYQIKNRSEGDAPVLFRFEKPVAKGFPFKVELFCRSYDGLVADPDQHIVSVRMEDAESLSAILLHDSYFGFLTENCRESQGILAADPTALIPLKARAWLDLSTRKSKGEKVNERDVSKHRYDVFRLAALLPEDRTVKLPGELHEDVVAFLEAHPADHPEWEAIRNAVRPTFRGSIKPATLISAIRQYYQIASA